MIPIQPLYIRMLIIIPSLPCGCVANILTVRTLRFGRLDLFPDKVRIQLGLREQEVKLAFLSLGLASFFLLLGAFEGVLVGFLAGDELVFLVPAPVQ